MLVRLLVICVGWTGGGGVGLFDDKSKSKRSFVVIYLFCDEFVLF